MRVLITGCAGFIGSHLTDRLLKYGHEVIGIDNFETGRRDNIPSYDEHNFTFFQQDISRNIRPVFYYCTPEIIVHTAASYKDPDSWTRDIEVNCLGTTNVVKLSKEFNVKRIVYLQTSLCYGLHPVEQPITLNHPINPAPNSYAITKTTGEQLIAMSGVPFVSLRLANIYGPRNLTGVIPTFYKKLSNSEKCQVVNTRRDFVYINDLINVLVRIIDGEGEKNYYHISTGKDYGIYEIHLRMMGNIIGKYPNSTILENKSNNDTETILLDPSETYKDFPEWRAETPLAEGLKKAIEWYNTHKFEETYTHLKKE